MTTEGQVSGISVLQSAGQSAFHKFLDDAAIATLESCHAQPFTDATGRPVPGTSTVEYLWQVQPDTPAE